ncbi:competence type IV pilus major pilin ComGC [Chryseomicrobium palamuruense]|uniref:ComG operon protein 3 n=1 Tax=Chryseomicrobium palamuruense TaxID=682973 RepID=A0ABV8UXR8_9BACL
MKKLLNQKGFTLVEMMIVLLIISVLLLVTIPNIAKHTATIDSKGCDAYINMVSAQIEAYKLEFKEIPTLLSLNTTGFIKEEKLVCPGGQELTIDVNGVVSEKAS